MASLMQRAKAVTRSADKTLIRAESLVERASMGVGTAGELIEKAQNLFYDVLVTRRNYAEKDDTLSATAKAELIAEIDDIMAGMKTMRSEEGKND